MRPYGTPKQLEHRRRHAIELLEKGMSVPAVARAVACTEGSVYYWRRAYRKKGEQGLNAKPAKGRTPKLSAKQKEELTRTLLKGALNAGYATDLWTEPRVAQIIERQFGVHYHVNHMWRFLRGLGWTCQKPKKQARERNEEAIAQWKNDHWPDVKKKPDDLVPILSS